MNNARDKAEWLLEIQRKLTRNRPRKLRKKTARHIRRAVRQAEKHIPTQWNDSIDYCP